MPEIFSGGRAKAARIKRLAKEWEGYSTKGISGWCIDSKHAECRHKFTYSECTCECHDMKPVKKRGRPRKNASN